MLKCVERINKLLEGEHPSDSELQKLTQRLVQPDGEAWEEGELVDFDWLRIGSGDDSRSSEALLRSPYNPSGILRQALPKDSAARKNDSKKLPHSRLINACDR